MVNHTQKTLNTRDNKEKDLATMEIQYKSSQEQYLVRKSFFDEKLKDYQIWKKANDIDGINY